jgi:hypothetical protein
MVDSPALTREQLDTLAEQLATLSLRIDLAKHAFFTHLRTFAAHEGWAGSGFATLPAWLAWRIGITPTTAREYVRVAKALGELPEIDAAFAAGKLSYAKVRALTRAAKRETAQGLVDVAMHATAAQIERTSAAYRRTRLDPSEAPTDLRRFMRRTTTSSGMVRIELQVMPEQAEVIWAAMQVALEGDTDDDSQGSTTSMAGASTDSGASAEAPESNLAPDPEFAAAERADAMVGVAQAFLAHRHRPHGTGFELVLMTSHEQLEQGPGGVGGFLRDGTPVPQHVARMLACDGGCVSVTTRESGEILDVGRARRTIPSAIWRALWLRDGGCRVPGCTRRHHLHAHHVVHWAEGGATKLSNLALLCPSHHALVHEGRLRVELEDGALRFRNAHGLALRAAPMPACEEVELAQRWLGTIEPELDVDHFPRWDGSRFDVNAVLGWMEAAERG